jgi:hypothetical protein
MLTRTLLCAVIFLAACDAVAPDDVTSANDALTGDVPIGSTLKTTGNVNLRSGPDTTYAIEDVATKGSLVTTINTASPTGRFYNVSFDGHDGWISGTYLQLVHGPQTGAGGGSAAAGGGQASSGGGSGATGGGSTTTSHWVPASDTTFFWDLQSAPPDLNKNVGAIDMDGFNNSATTVAALHAMGKKAVCYMDVGSYEPGRPDSSQFPSGLLGNGLDGWPGERWLDIRMSGSHWSQLRDIMMARFKICQQKGFDAVEPDNMDGYSNNPGFSMSGADQIAYNRWVANTVHSLGMAVFQKNDLDQIPSLVSYFDGLLNEQCNAQGNCDQMTPFVNAGKPVWDAEYTDDGETTAKFCTKDVNAGYVGALYSLDLNGSVFHPCSNDVGVKN